MLFHGTFTSEEMQVDHHVFHVEDAAMLSFTLLDGEFEHVLVEVKDPSGAMRALLTYKTRVKQACLTDSGLTSTNGCVPGPISDGDWTLDIVRTYPVEGGYSLRIDVNLGSLPREGSNPLKVDRGAIVEPRSGWFVGDFHAHGMYSDGRISQEGIAKSVEAAGLDFFAMSDHSIATTKFPSVDAMVLPSTEVTWDDSGHYNVHGLADLPDYARYVNGAASKSEALDKLFKDMKGRGCVISLNHPFPRGWTLSHDFDIRSLSLFEVINAPHLFDPEVDNERALRLFDFLWSRGHRLMAVGGSDAHKKNYFDTYPIGIPKTKVYCNGLSVNNVLHAAVAGHSYVQVREDFEIAFRRPGEQGCSILPGERAEGCVECRARCTAPVVWELVHNGKAVYASRGRVFDCEFEVALGDWWRLQARDKSGELLLVANPVHNLNITPEECRFQALLDEFYSSEIA